MFISFEGIDWCGKSTQIKKLKGYFSSHGKRFVEVREPGGTEISESIRSILLHHKNHEMTAETELLLMSAARSQLVRQTLMKEQTQVDFIIADRYFDSTTAYQGYGRGLNLEFIQQLNHFAVASCIPDLTFILDITAEAAFERRKDEIRNDRIEAAGLIFFERVRNGYLQLAQSSTRFKVLDATLNPDEIHFNIVKEIGHF